MSHSEHINELSAALSKAQGAMKAATFNRINPHFKNRYADLAAVWDAIRDPLSKNGLSVTQTMESDGNGSFMLHTILHHASGQWLSSDYPLPAGAKPQEMGSALTYARRYSLSAIVGIAPDEDDDANEAQKAPKPVPPTKAAAALIEAAKQAVAPLDPGEPREINLGDDVDWPWFGHVMIERAATEQWAQWREANMLNMERMKNEARAIYDRMIAGIKNARP